MTVKSKALVLGLAMVVMSAGPGLAFRDVPVGDQTSGGKPPAAATAGDAAPSITFDASEDPDVVKGGTELHVPGIGRLGVLPKLDFGLELLYSEQNTGDAAFTDQGADVGSDVKESERGLQLRGSITHQF